ncbi:hypothetical protein EB810_08935 [Altererythrobacter sp. FM1]|nr:hypothetical protein EB810_08935 [Altererythrobacter sp. FM1]
MLERLGHALIGFDDFRRNGLLLPARDSAALRLALLQRALRRRLLNPPGRPFHLNRRDPVGAGFDFTN